MNSSSVWLLGCEATGNRFSEALFRIYGGGGWDDWADLNQSWILREEPPFFQNCSLGFRLCATQRPAAEEPPAEASE